MIYILIILTVALSFGFAFIRAILDAVKIGSKEIINHTKNAFVVTIIASSWSLFFCDLNLIKFINLDLLFLSVYWLSFDMLLNRFIGEYTLFVGSTSGIDKSFQWIGRKIKVNPGKVMLIVKILFIVIFISIPFIK